MSEKQPEYTCPRALDFAVENILDQLVRDLGVLYNEAVQAPSGLRGHFIHRDHVREVLRKVGPPYYREDLLK